LSFPLVNCRWLLIVIAAGCGTVASAATETLTYVLTPRPAEGRLDVELTWRTHGRPASRLCVAKQWGTVSDVPALLGDLTFEGANSVQGSRACWDITHEVGAVLRCSYSVDAGQREFSWENTYHPLTTETFFHGMGSAFLLSPAPGGSMPAEYDVLLRWKLPEGWKAACSWGMGRTVGAPLSSEALRRSVYLAGELVTERVPVEGAKSVTVAMLDSFEFSAAELAEFAARVIAQQCAFMHEEDFPDFVVTAIPVGEPVSAGSLHISGMGLHHSFALCVAPRASLTEGVQHLFAHELFHYWNGGVLAPADADEPVDWLIEGFTDYYALRILYESGCWTPQTYARWINRHLREYDANPARNISNEEARQRYWSERATAGEVVYQRGLLLGLRWHRLARDKGVREGVDKLFLGLVDRARRGGFQLTNAGVRRVGQELLGSWFASEFDRYVERAETIDVPADALAPDFIGRTKTVYEFELGFDRARSLSEMRVVGLASGSAAARAGLREGDELLGWAVHGDPDRQIRLQVQRDKQIRTISYYPRGDRRQVLQFRPRGSRVTAAEEE
jgi:predicted metalloprotease with PDZ domain